MKEKILNICQYLCCKEVSADEPLIVSGLLDSFRLMELICSLEDEFHIVFLAEEISDVNNFSCVDRIADIVSHKIKDV